MNRTAAGKYHNIQFKRTGGKDLAKWDGFRAPRTVSPLTELRMLAQRLRVSQPRINGETRRGFSNRTGRTLHGLGKSHLELEETQDAIHSWLWQGIEPVV